MRTTERGMTLVELLVAMVVGALIIGAALSLFDHNHRLYHEQDEIVIMQQEMRAILSQMATQIRMAGFDPTRAGGFGFAHRSGIGDPDHGRVTNATAIYFTMDANRDGVLQENGTGSNDEHGGYRLKMMVPPGPRRTGSCAALKRARSRGSRPRPISRASTSRISTPRATPPPICPRSAACGSRWWRKPRGSAPI